MGKAIDDKAINSLSEDDYKQMVAGAFQLAKFYKDKYDAMISVGFTPVQALEILKARGMNP